MSEEGRVIANFKKGVLNCLNRLEGHLERGEIEKSAWCLNELMSDKKRWLGEYERPGHTLETGSFARGIISRLDTKSTKRLAELRVRILDEAIKNAETMFKQKRVERAA